MVVYVEVENGWLFSPFFLRRKEQYRCKKDDKFLIFPIFRLEE